MKFTGKCQTCANFDTLHKIVFHPRTKLNYVIDDSQSQLNIDNPCVF